jgi:tRNA (guanine-N7-)-methyltransferase
MASPPKLRQIRSYICRETQLSPALEQLFETTWPQYGLTCAPHKEFDLNAVFGRIAPRTLEIGFGNGNSFMEMAKIAPERDFIGIEMYRRGIARVLGNINVLHLSNIRVVHNDAVEVLTHNIPHESLNTIQIFFADPWPKTRHHKRRLIQPEFIELLTQKLEVGGTLHLATDWEHYSQHMMSVISQNKKFLNLAGEGHFMPRPEFRPLTKYEKRAEQEGRTIFDLLFQRVNL